MATRDILRAAGLAAILGLGAPLLAACEEQGPAEEAGEAVDDAAEDAGDAMEDTGEELQEQAD